MNINDVCDLIICFFIIIDSVDYDCLGDVFVVDVVYECFGYEFLQGLLCIEQFYCYEWVIGLG